MNYQLLLNCNKVHRALLVLKGQANHHVNECTCHREVLCVRTINAQLKASDAISRPI
jgi:hypothetical protein